MTLTPQQIAGHKAAYTRRVNAIESQVTAGTLTRQQAAGQKSHAKRVLNKALREA